MKRMNATTLGRRTEPGGAARGLWISCALLALAACGGGGSGSPPPPPASISISGSSDILDAGASRTFTATVANAANTAVTWSVVESGGGTITTGGV